MNLTGDQLFKRHKRNAILQLALASLWIALGIADVILFRRWTAYGWLAIGIAYGLLAWWSWKRAKAAQAHVQK